MELSELHVISRLQENTHDDISVRITGNGILLIEFERSSVRIIVKDGIPTIDKVVNAREE